MAPGYMADLQLAGQRFGSKKGTWQIGELVMTVREAAFGRANVPRTSSSRCRG